MSSIIVGSLIVGRDLASIGGDAFALDSESRIRGRHMLKTESTIPASSPGPSNHTHRLNQIDTAPPTRNVTQEYVIDNGAGFTSVIQHLVNNSNTDPIHTVDPARVGMRIDYDSAGLFKAMLGRESDGVQVICGSNPVVRICLGGKVWAFDKAMLDKLTALIGPATQDVAPATV